MLSNDATHVLRGYEKAYCSYNGIVGGQQGMFLSRFKNGMRKQGKERHEKARERDWLGVSLWLGVRVSLCMVQRLCDPNVHQMCGAKSGSIWCFLISLPGSGKGVRGEGGIGWATSICREVIRGPGLTQFCSKEASVVVRFLQAVLP